MNEMRDSRDLLAKQQKEMTERTIEAMNRQQSNTQQMMKDMREAQAAQREELRKQKEQEMAILRSDSEARERVADRNYQLLVK